MPNTVTLSKEPSILPYLEYQYRSSTAGNVEPWFLHEYVSRTRSINHTFRHIELEAGEQPPNEEAISSIVRVTSKSHYGMLNYDASVFHGEAIVTWRAGAREVSLISRGAADDPKLLRYESGTLPSKHRILNNAKSSELDNAIVWLHT